MRPNHEALMREIDRAWPRRCLAACEVDFVRDENGLPKPLIGGVWTGVTLVSLDWGHEEELWLTRPLTEIEKLANVEIPHKAYPDFQPGPVPKSVAAEQKVEEARRTDSANAPSPRSALTPVTDGSGEVDTERFPGGIVPSQPPQRVLGGRRRTRRRR